MKPNAHDYDQAKQLTALSLQKLIDTTEQLTYLPLPDRTALIEEISRVVPAGNVPSLVAAGLAKLPGRAVPAAETRRNLALLMQGMQTFLDRAVYQAFFVGPATVLSAYQMLLRLAGKDLEQSFPEGTWQFYVEFGIREDSGRHACETTGFHMALQRERLRLTTADEMAAWITACAWLLDRYPVLLANEWIERARLHHLAEMIPDETITIRWLRSRPYGTPSDTNVDFAEYRQLAFELFCNAELAKLSDHHRKRIESSWKDKQTTTRRVSQMAAYQHQMTILATLNPGEHSDQRVPLSSEQVCIAVIAGGRYYLIDISGPVSAERARPICAAILRDKPAAQPATLDRTLCTVYRREQPALRKLLPEETRIELERLRTAPIIINWDLAQSNQSLAEIRSGRRGVGDHALTLFRASNSMAFDLSHIFFDGTWGMAVSEILTNQAVRFARQLSGLARIENVPAVRCLTLEASSKVAAQARKVTLPAEVNVETAMARLDLIQQARRSLRKRNEKLYLTINDILVMYRSVFGGLYQPSTDLMQRIAALEASDDTRTRQAAELVQTALEMARQLNPALLIPMDASSVSPRERVYPTTFRNPFNRLLDQHRQAISALEALETTGFLGRALAHRHFEEARREYLVTLQAFGQILRRYKAVTLKGGSVSTATIKLLAGLPNSVQRLLDGLPGHFDVLNDLVKGQEVFSNVGQVAPYSSLTRFNTAKDDNEKKVLAWGVITDANGTLRISMRDTRPHVGALCGVRQRDLALQMAQEYVDAYALGLNVFVEELTHIARAGQNK
jgi:hypothetical protein